jgi:hypothetical protein
VKSAELPFSLTKPHVKELEKKMHTDFLYVWIDQVWVGKMTKKILYDAKEIA